MIRPESEGIDWRARYEQAESDVAFWKTRAQTWEARAKEAEAKLPKEAPETDLPPAVHQAIAYEAQFQSPDVARQMIRAASVTYSMTPGDAGVKLAATMQRIQTGDQARLAALLGDED